MTQRSPAPYALFFLSGASGLVYQVVWVRQFGNVFGNTVHSAALVTAVFMCGLGVGSYLAGRWADRRRSPAALLAAYGWSEALVGALGVALAWLLPRMASLSASLASYTRGADGWYQLALGGEIARHALATLLLAPMTLLMGGTLTLLIRYLVRGDLGHAGVRIGVLYGLNTAGAALGCVITDFTLVPALGLFRAQLASASINLAVGAISLALSQRAPRIYEEAAPAPAPSEAEESAAPEGARHAVAFTALALALTGFAGMGMEMVWFRFLGSAMGQYRTVFSLLLAVILAGMWAGATLGGWLTRRFGKPATLFVIVEVLFVLATVGLLAAFDRTAFDRYLASAFRALGGPASGLPRSSQAWAMIRAMALLVGLPSLLMGATYPLANANVQRLGAQVGRRAGALYLANTTGSVLGSLLAGFVLLPALGTQGSVLALAVAAGLAIIPVHLSSREKPREAGQASADDYVLAGGFLALVVGISCFGMLLPANYLQRVSLASTLGERLLAVSEGPNETIAVTVAESGSRRLWTNGHSMSVNTPEAQRYMRAFAHVPLLMMEEPRSVLVICFGVGNTLHAASLHPGVTRLDLADLSRNVLSQHGYFAATNGGVLLDPRVSVFVNDGRQHLRMTPPGTYDLVTLEPPPIGQAGVSALYSREFYELVRSRLSEGGFLTQWLPVEQLEGRETLALVRAFVDVFPSAVLLSGERRDLVLMGSTRPVTALDVRAVARRLQERPLVAADLERVNLGRLSELVGTFAGSAETLARASAGARPVTDDAPSMEYSVMSKLMAHQIPPDLFDTGKVAAFCPDCEGAAGLEDLRPHLEILGRLYAANTFLHYRSFAPGPVEIDVPAALAGDDGARARAILKSGYLQVVVGIDPDGMPMSMRPAALASLEAFAAAHQESAVAALRLGLAYLAARRNGDAEVALRRAVERAPDSAPARLGHALALRMEDRFDEAVDENKKGLDLAPGDVPGHVMLLDTLAAAHRQAEIPAVVTRLLAIDPENGPAQRLLCIAAFRKGEVEKARAHCTRALGSGMHLETRLLAPVFGP